MLPEKRLLPSPPGVPLNCSGINKPEEDRWWLLLLVLLLVVLLLEKKLRLKRLAAVAEEELLGLFWRSGSCINPWKGLFCNKPWWDCCSSWKSWFEPGRKKADEGVGCAGRNDEGLDGGIR